MNTLLYTDGYKVDHRRQYPEQTTGSAPQIVEQDYIKKSIIFTIMKKRRKFTKEEKLSILKEASANGVLTTLEKHDIYPATYYLWKKKFEEMGEVGLDHGITKARLKKIGELEQEVELLKQLLAEKELESRLKDELLKKKYPKVRRKYS